MATLLKKGGSRPGASVGGSEGSPSQRELVDVRVEPQIARDAPHGGDGTAFAALDAARVQAVSVEGEHRVEERAADGA